MEKGQGKGTDTLATDNVFTRNEYIKREAAKSAIMWCEDENNFDFSQGLIAAEDTLDNIPAADVVARDCYDKILAENDDMRAIIDTYGGLENIQSAFVKLHEIENADVVPVRHGRWKKSYADNEAFGVRPFFRYCSECHEATVHQYTYCHNCGAIMDKDGDGDV